MKRKYAEGGEVDRKKILRDEPLTVEKIKGAMRNGMLPTYIGPTSPKAAPKNPDDIPPRNLQDALDEVTRRKEDKAIEGVRKRMGEGFKKGGKVSSASKRADGIAKKGKTRGRIV